MAHHDAAAAGLSIHLGSALRTPETEQSEKLLSLSLGRPAPGVRALRAVGEIDMLTTPRLVAALQLLLSAHPHTVVVDFTGLTFLSAAGLGTLAETAVAGHDHGIVLRLVAHGPAVLRPVQLTRLDEHIPLHATLADAIDNPTNIPSPRPTSPRARE